MKELRTEIEIAGSPDEVWEVLTHFGLYQRWNPFLVRVDGDAILGGRTRVQVRPPHGRSVTLTCQITVLEPGRELRWTWHVGLPGLYGGEHSFRIEQAGEGRVRFIDCEVFHGALLPILGRSIDTDTRQGFEQMDQALKARVEAKG